MEFLSLQFYTSTTNDRNACHSKWVNMVPKSANMNSDLKLKINKQKIELLFLTTMTCPLAKVTWKRRTRLRMA